MQLMDFFDKVEAATDLVGVDTVQGDDAAFDAVRVGFAPNSIVVTLPVTAILEQGWERLRDVIIGATSSDVLYHMSRIVGYYSRIENWNKSKLGELRDRRLGNYRLA